MFNHNSETKGHGSIRKNKVYGTIGVIALGAIAMFSNNKTASADEVSSSEPTTTTPVASAADTSLAVQSQAASAEAAAPATATDSTAPTANATAPVEATSPAAPAAESTPTALASSASDTTPVTYTAPAAAPAAPAKATETEPVKVDSTDLDNAVEDAKKAGVEVTREADVDRGTATTPQETEQKIAEIKNDYKKQTEEIKSVTEAAKVDTAKYNEAKTQYDTAKAEYDVKKSEYDTAKAKYDYDLAQYHVLKTQYDTAKAQYDRDLAAYNEAKLAYAAAKTQYDVDKEAYDKAKTTYDTDKAAYDIAKATYDAAKISYDAAKVKYEKDLEKYKEDRVAYNIAKTAYDEAQNKYVEDLAQYNKDKAAYDTAKEAYDTAKAAYDTAKTQYDSDLAKYKVDKAAYDVAKTTYDRELAQYQVYKEQYDTAKAQYDRDLGQYQILKAQYDAAKTQYAIDKAAYDQAKAQYTVDKAAYDQAKAQYDAALAKYKADSEQYKRDMEEYTRAMIEAEAKKHQDGYLTEAKSQSLIFKSEPNALRSIDPSVHQYTKKELDDLVRSWGISPTNPDKTKSTAYSYFNQINSNNAYARLVLEKNKPVDVTYTGLQNSSFNGKKISKVVYTYTLKATEFGDGTKMSMYASDDPTVTAWYNDFFTSTNINVKVKFYGEDGELIDPTGSLVSFSSLNRGNGSGAVYKDAIESVRYFNGKLIPISGSSIKIQANNSAYADSSNAEKALGSRWETLEWDTAESDKKWYGAIVGEVTQPEISFNMVSYKSGNVWFAFNSDIKAIGVPIKPVEPVEPKAPTAPVEPKAPTAPVEPVAPTAPVEPKAPTAPVEPKAPTAPVEPKAPTAPVEPKAPTAPVEPKAPTAPVEPKAPTAPVEPKAPTAPVEPKAPTAPVEPKAPTAPVEPKAPTPPTTPAIRTAKYHYNTLKSTIEYGNVVVDYQDKQGNTISPRVVDTPDVRVGTAYDTTDHKTTTITTADGTIYRIDTSATQGNESGQVVKGTTRVVYVYDKVEKPVEKKYGDVTVEYKNKDGVSIAPKVTDTPRSEVGTDYDTTDQRKDTITTVDGKKYKLDLTATQGAETGKVVEGNTTIIYYYDLVPEKKYGDVTVEYKNKDGVTIAPKVTDTPRSEVGTDYDTKDQRKDTITTVDGKKYKLDLTATQGAETGKVVEGNTNVVYYYDLVPDAPQKKYGDVTVEYKNKDGVTIAPKVTDTPRSEVGTDYDTTDQRKDTITTVDGKKYKLDLTATQGAETGKVVEGNTNIVYYYDLVKTPEEYGNVVVDYQDKKGNTIAPRVVDTPTAKVGTAYDTTDHKPVTIVSSNGKTYRIDPTATQGQESGEVVKGTTRVVYVYDEVLGDVTVHYKDENGKVIKEPEKDTTGAPINTLYDTRDHAHKTITTQDGRVYEIIPEKTIGLEQGRIVEGNTDVTYIYKEVFGDVLVHYVDESGNKIKDDVTDTAQARVGESYDTTDNKPSAIKHGDKVYNIIPEKTKGQEQGKVVKGVTEVTYVYKAVQAEPKKTGTNAKGEDVNGKTMLAGSTEVYTINIDNDQYKGTTGLVDQDKQVGLTVIEKYSSKFVTPNLDAVRMTTEDGKVVSGFTTKIYKSVAEAPQKIQDYIKAKGLTIDGEFAATTSDDPVAYTNNYALKGINLKLIFPTTVKRDIKEASKYDNKAYQIDFAGIAETNIVTNNIPKINPKKDVVATVEDGLKDQNSLDGKTVKVGAVYNFELNTSYLPAKRGQSIDKIEVKDTYSPLVEYNGVHKWIANTDILLKDSTKIAKGTDLTQYVNQNIDHKARTVVYSFSNDFLSKISDDSEFQAIGYMQVKQLDNGTVKNTFTEIINNVERDSNTVTLVSPKEYGDVVVHYVDESGKKIKEDVTDTSRATVGTSYDTTDHKSISIKYGNKVYNLVPEKTKGQEKGKVVKGVTEVTYVYKAVQAEPKKTGTNAKGEDINGKTMLAGSTEVYTINIDNDQYKGTTGLVDQDKQAGLMVVEKYDSKFVTPNLDAVRMTTEDGKVVSGFTTKIYKSVAEAPQKVQDYIKAKGLTIDGEFAVTTSDDPVAYTNNYALKGINLKLIFPTTVKKDIKEASKYENKAYQIDFAGIAETNIVTNNIPKINPKKDVVATVEDGLKDQNSLNGKTVNVGDVYNFELNTSYLPAKRGQSIDKIEVKDTYSPLVEYNGVHKWIANTDILLKDGTKIAKGTDLTQYVNQNIDHKARTVVYSFSNDFLSKISDDSEFQAIGYMQVKQLDNGTVKNTFTEIINNVERDSNTVTVVTPEKPQTPPEKPQTPPEKPQTPPATPKTPVVPTTPQTELPETGETDHTGAAVLGLAMVASAMSILGFKKRKEEE